MEIHPLRDVPHLGWWGPRDMMLVGNRRLAGCTGAVVTELYFEQDHFREVTQMVKSHIVILRQNEQHRAGGP